MLAPNHPLRALLDRNHTQAAPVHPRSIALMTSPQKKKVIGSLMNASKRLDKLSELFEPFAQANSPGHCLLDLYRDRVHFTDWDPVEGVTPGYIRILDSAFVQAKANNEAAYAAVDASLPTKGKFQAVSAAVVLRGDNLVKRVSRVAGRVTAPDAELMAITLGVVHACAVDGLKKIYIFTDHIAAAKRAVDPSVHSRQSLSLAVCKTLTAWMAGDPDRQVHFYAVPSKSKWPFHTGIHDYVTKFPRVAYGSKPFTSLDRIRKDAVDMTLEEWQQLFRQPSYRGRHFMMLKDDKGKLMQPTYLHDGSWLPQFDDPRQMARFSRAALNHAPIGSYYT